MASLKGLQPLRGFLTHAKSALRTAIEQGQSVTLVIGNESAGEDAGRQTELRLMAA